MAGGADRSQKTEKPTAKRRREARERGQVPRTPDLTTWAGLLVATMVVRATVSRGAAMLRDLTYRTAAVIADPSAPKAWKLCGEALKQAGLLVMPFFLAIMAVGVAANLAQVGFTPSAKRLKPNFSRLNLVKGIKRLFGMSSWWEVAKALIKTTVLLLIAWPAALHAVHVLTAGGGALETVATTTAKSALTIVRNVAAAGLVIAGIDYLVQRRRINKDLMMTKAEIKEELRQQEGSPQMRQAVRSRMSAISRNRMIKMVARADVVIVNPTHYAVALRYVADRGAPEVLAKGADYLAAKIRLEAARHDVPIVSEPVLARALYSSCSVGQVIPVAMYEAVARVLAFVFSLKAKGRRGGYHELKVQPLPA